jgi:c-di-GMP-binding flagellar brake protein YcgR
MSYMYSIGIPTSSERRSEPRFRVRVHLNQYIRERAYRAEALDISETGLSVQRLTERVVRPARIVALELELPGTREVIWASAEARFDSIGDDFHVSGLRFAAMARKHQRLLSDYVHERIQRLERLLGRRSLYSFS